MTLNPENQPEPAPEFIELVQRVLDHEASLDDIARLNAILPRDPVALRYFVKMRMLHSAMEDHFGTTSKALDSIEGRVIGFPDGDSETAPSEAARTRRGRSWRRWAAAAAVVLLSSLVAFWGGRRLIAPPAFEIVARYSTGSSVVPASGTWLKNGQRLSIVQGAVEFRSVDGNSLTLEGPGELTIHDPRRLTLNSGKLWTVINGETIHIQTPQGEVTDLGTTFGIDQSSGDVTRVDVFDGSVRLADPSDPTRHVEASTGQGILRRQSQWPPEQCPADASLYTARLRGPVGIAFVRDPDEASLIGSALPFNARWTPVSSVAGKTQPSGAAFEVAWAGSSFFSTGSQRSPEGALFRTHLCGNSWAGQSADRHAEAAVLDLPTGPYGIVIQLRGMTNWLAGIGAKSYRVTLLRNSAVAEVEFLPVTAHAGPPSEETYLMTHQLWEADYHPANFPDAADGTGARAIGIFRKPFTADLLTLSLAVEEPGDRRRTNVSALIVTPQF